MDYDIEKGKNKFKFFDLDGNNLALDFVNTLEYRGTEDEIDWLSSYGDGLCWAERTSILTIEQVATLVECHGDHAAEYLKKIIECRTVVHQYLSQVIDGNTELTGIEVKFNRLYLSVKKEIKASGRLVAFSWIYPELESAPLGFLQPLLQAAVDLLIAGNLERLKRCSNPACGWLYYDNSKNNSRRWCCMKTCGNRAKANRFYQAHR